MTRYTADDVDTALRSLDPAVDTSLSEDGRRRADATFARIVSGVEDAPPVTQPRRPRWRLRRLVPLGVLAGAGAAVCVMVLGGGTSFASWTAQPQPLSPARAAQAAATCRDELDMSRGSDQTLLAERRGGWTYVLVSAPAGEGTCLMPNAAVGQEAQGQEIFADLAPPVPEPTVDPRGIEEIGSTAVPTDGGLFRKGYLTWTYGHAGTEVESITVRTPIGTDVEATVQDGRFAAWWPSHRPSSEHPEVMGAWHCMVTLKDGDQFSVDG